MGLAGAYSIPANVLAAGGDYVKNDVMSKTATLTGVVSDHSAPYSDSYWTNESGEIWSGGDNAAGGTDAGVKIVDGLDENDIWNFLAKNNDYFVTFNNTEKKVVIRNASDGVEWGNFTGPTITEGIAIDGDEILCYNRGVNPPKIERFSFTGTHLDDMLLPYPTVPTARAIAFDPTTGDIIMSENTKFNVVSFNNGTEYASHETFSYSDGGASGNGVINGMSYDPIDNLVLVGVDDPDVGHSDYISWYKNKPTPTPEPTPSPTATIPTPTPSPTPDTTPSVTPTPSVSPTIPVPTPTPKKTLEDKIGIFRPSIGLWAIQGVTRAYFGGSGDRPLYRDYDGDGSFDIAIYRTSSGLWAIRGISRVYFGGSADEPVPGDYTGNGTDEIGIFRPASGLWAVKGVIRSYFGSGSDDPVPADYDGDGSADIGIYRAASGLWAIRGFTRSYFGGTTDEPVPGDYDGDGTAKIGIFRPISGLWAVRGVTRSYFGGLTDQPVPGDYDGSGTKAIGIFRATSGLWAIKEVTRCYFGGVGDVPVGR